MPKIRSLWISSQNFDPMLFKLLKVFTQCFVHCNVLLGLLVSNTHILGHKRKQKAWGRSPQAIVWDHCLLVVHIFWRFYCSSTVSIWKRFDASRCLLASFMMVLYLTCQSVYCSCFGQKQKIPVSHQWMYRWHSQKAQHSELLQRRPDLSTQRDPSTASEWSPVSAMHGGANQVMRGNSCEAPSLRGLCVYPFCAPWAKRIL